MDIILRNQWEIYDAAGLLAVVNSHEAAQEWLEQQKNGYLKPARVMYVKQTDVSLDFPILREL